ncbi:MAG: DUF3696 domain-containing protein [Dehalococcoidia bacterium]|nr:DUF3696 domain-containing protein [Dehalococcoidia bacterium]
MSSGTKREAQLQSLPGITAISVSGYKSLSRKQRLEIRPLTLLAGANSSGKSSAIQPLLILKQTLDSSYDPGSLLLNGPNVQFTSADQLLSRLSSDKQGDELCIGIDSERFGNVELIFKRLPGKRLELDRMTYTDEGQTFDISQDMGEEEMKKLVPGQFREFLTRRGDSWTVMRERCFFGIFVSASGRRLGGFPSFSLAPQFLSHQIQGIIHLPAFRGDPERTYPNTAVGPNFPGTFEKYVASIVARWQDEKDTRMQRLSQALQNLGLTSTVRAQSIDETQVELRVGRLLRGSRGNTEDLVNIADVGYGVSQVLPVVVALLAAEPGQLVYIEQPEIHLHPRAQAALANILADGAKRGFKIVVETHSTILLLALQTLVAEGKLPPNLVKLHWFSRLKDGSTEITSTDVDENGAFGDWPVDFADVLQETESRYLDAAERSLLR